MIASLGWLVASSPSSLLNCNLHQFCFVHFIFFLRLVRRRRRKNDDDDDEEHKKKKMTSWCSLLVSFKQICESFVFCFCFFVLGRWGRRWRFLLLLLLLPSSLLWILFVVLGCFNVWNCVNFVQLLLLSALDFAVASLKIML